MNDKATHQHPATQQPKQPNHLTREAREKLAPAPLPADDPEITGAGPVIRDDHADDHADDNADADDSADANAVRTTAATDDAARDDDIDIGDDGNGGIGRDNKGQAP